MSTQYTTSTLSQLESQLQDLLKHEEALQNRIAEYRSEANRLDAVAYQMFNQAAALSASRTVIEATPISSSMTAQNKQFLLEKLQKDADFKLSGRSDFNYGVLRQAQEHRNGANREEQRANALAADIAALRAAIAAAVAVLP